ncbi:hypothetical protein [Micromonospora sp. NPDC005710]|uniref:hypothetical protein n=1 Tax=Micromonospora sp. NPDC005710 TaxID=3157051 RepID=UPI0033C2F4E5
MKQRTTLLVLGLTGGLLIAAGCTPKTEPTSAEKPVQVTTAVPSPTPDARSELVAELQRSQGVAHRYAVRGGLPEGQKVTGTGAFDPKKRRFQSTVAVTGGKYPSAGSRIVIGTDSYVRPSDDKDWVHVDLKRVKRDDIFLRFDWVDPTGLKAFTSSIISVDRVDPHTYAGRFDPNGNSTTSFLPVGAPSIVSIGTRLAPFRITTDDAGWVTSITVELSPNDGPKLTMTTTMKDHGKPLKINAPKGAGEAADFYYRK